MKQFIKELSNSFETRKRENGKSFVALKRDKYDQFKDIVRSMHGVDMLPDDFRYNTIDSILSCLVSHMGAWPLNDSDDLDQFLDAYRHEIVDGLVDVYHKDLTQWIDSHSMRGAYVDEAMKNFGLAVDFYHSLQLGQYQEIDEIYSNIGQALLSQCETLENEAV